MKTACLREYFFVRLPFPVTRYLQVWPGLRLSLDRSRCEVPVPKYVLCLKPISLKLKILISTNVVGTHSKRKQYMRKIWIAF